jgi:hypothetical protein
MSKLEEAIEMLKPVMEYGVEITIRYCEAGGFDLNLNTQAKSECALKFVDDKIMAHMRYDIIKEINTLEDIKDAVLDCLCGRDYMHMGWSNFIEDFYDKHYLV